MSQRILLFESDAGFAGDMKSSFEQLGAAVDIVEDGPKGIEHAEGNKPDLILLSIELPGMNGFLVCKKIKKHASLKDVPLMILSSEATEETFEQHKKLRTRAEDYLHKPIGFDDLLQRVQQFVKIEGNGAAADDLDMDDLMVEDDDMLVDDEDVASAGPPEPPAASEPVEEFADEAFAEIEADEDEAVIEIEEDEETTGVAPEPEPEPAPAPVAAAAADDGKSRKALDAAEQQVATLKRGADAAERKVADANKARELAEERAASAERALNDANKKGGVTSREFLDLREQLNKKDRELLELRDQVTSRDKQLIEASDKALTFERQLADMRDENLERERELSKTRDAVEALTQDKEAGKKRQEDLKARLERAEAKGKELGTEIDGLKSAHEAALAAKTSEHEDALGAASATHAAESAAAKEAHASALAEARETAAAELKDQLASLEAKLTEEASESLANAEASHKAALASTRAEAEETLEAARTELEQKSAEELTASKESHQKEMARVGRALNDAETKHQLLEERFEESEAAKTEVGAELASMTEARDAKSAQLADVEGKLAEAREKIRVDGETLDRVRKAMSIGLGLLEEQNKNTLD